MPRMPFTIDGWRPTDAIRVRSTWRGAVIERLWERRDGGRVWRRETGAINISSESPEPKVGTSKTGEAA